MRSDTKEWKSSAGVCVAAVVSTSFGESEDCLCRVVCVLLCMEALGRG